MTTKPIIVRYIDPVEERSDDPTRARDRLQMFRQAVAEHGPDVVVQFRERPWRRVRAAGRLILRALGGSR
jgi:DNA-binding LacI/PurR family transcriptional regulator